MRAGAYFVAMAVIVSGLAAVGPATGGEPGETDVGNEFYFTRGNYGGYGGEEWGPRWAIDFPAADEHFLVALRRLTGIDAYDSHNAIPVDDEKLKDFPFLYILEVASLSLSDAQAAALRSYLLAGGFMMVDDSWGSYAWQNFQMQMARVFPEYEIVDIPLEHPIFHVFYDIEEIIQVPNVRQTSGPTYEYDGKVPYVRGIFDDEGRLMVVINWNTDLGDAWEWADAPNYPLRYSTYAFEVGINTVIYAMSH